MNVKERKELAMKCFADGYNCAQSVALAFADLVDIKVETLAKLSSSFGGGMGRLREVCGAVTGMFMIAGMLYGYGDSETGEKKAEHYALIQELAKEFESQCGSIICRDLLDTEGREAPIPAARTKEYYEKRPCGELVGIAAEILAKKIKDRG